MTEWNDFLSSTFFVPCPDHPQYVCTSYCRQRSRATCAKCPKSGQQVRVYRNMFHDVVQVPSRAYRGMETFRCNGRWVVYLRPVRDVGQYTDHAVQSCPCGRAINKEDSFFCSIQCAVTCEYGQPVETSTYNRETLARQFKITIHQRTKSQKPTPLFKNKKPTKRKPLQPVQSPCF